MRSLIFMNLFFLVSAALPARTVWNHNSERDAIKKVTLEYIDGLYNQDSVMLQHAISPGLASHLDGGLTGLADLVAEGAKREVSAVDRLRGVLIFDQYGDIAVVRADLTHWVSYLQLRRTKGQWQIRSLTLSPRANLISQPAETASNRMLYPISGFSNEQGSRLVKGR